MNECRSPRGQATEPGVLLSRIGELEQERERLLRELEEMMLAVERAGRAKSDFLSNMSHELRAPLNRIMGFTEIIRDGLAGPVSEEQKEYLGDVYESAQQLCMLLNDILDLSNAQAGKAELDLRDVNVKALLEACVTLFREKAVKHRIGVEVHVAEDVSVVTADERKLKQVLFNLLGNAFKFTGDGGGVRVMAERTGDDVQVTVRDTGIGIAEEDQAGLFEPFDQIEHGLTKRHSSTGLGLSLCREYVELHGGSIRVESRPGEGSAFSFTIPAGSSQTGKEVFRADDKSVPGGFEQRR